MSSPYDPNQYPQNSQNSQGGYSQNPQGGYPHQGYPQPSASPQAGYGPRAPLTPQDERTWSMISHIVGGAANVFTSCFGGWIAALIFFLLYKDRGPFVRQHVIAELNFQLTILLATIVAYITIFTIFLAFIGMILIPAAYVAIIIYGILTSIAANRGFPAKFHVAINFIH